MGKFGPRLKGKGRRWKKGHSSSSNPVTKKYRDAAKSGFFAENLGTSTLTSDAIKTHNALMGVKSTVENDEAIEVDEVEDATTTQDQTFRSFKTFATDWSSCSNVSFSKFLTRFSSNSALHKEMLAVLAAVTEVIKDKGGVESSTEYFGALMTTLSASESEETVAAVLSLLGMGIKNVPKAVLQKKFGEATEVFMQLLARFQGSDNTSIARASIGCLSVLLRNQELAAWRDSSIMRVLDSILALTIHSKPKVRKAAQHAVAIVLKSGGEDEVHPAARRVAGFCSSCIARAFASTLSETTLLHALTFTKEVIATFPNKELKLVCDWLFQVMSKRGALVLSCGMQVLHSLFVARPPPFVVSPTINSQIISVLFQFQRSSYDTQPILAWTAVIQEAFLNLAKLDIALCCRRIPRLFRNLSELWLMNVPEVLAAVTHTLGAVAMDCIRPIVVDPFHNHCKAISEVFEIVQSGLEYEYRSAWKYVIHLLGVLFEACGNHCEDEIRPCLEVLGILRATAQFSLTSELDNSISKAIRAMGPRFVVDALPLEVEEDIAQPVPRSWLLPIVRDSVAKQPLSVFVETFLPLADQYRSLYQYFTENNNKIGCASFDLLECQVWALLPSFCDHPPDIKDSFKKLARRLGDILDYDLRLRLAVLAALRKLINCVKKDTESPTHAADLEELSRFAKNFLPLLLNIYLYSEEIEGVKLAALETISVYLSITKEEVLSELLKNVFSKLESNYEDLIHLLRVMLVYHSEENVKRIYNLCVENITLGSNPKKHKKSFRCLEDICRAEGDGCSKFMEDNLDTIQNLLIESSTMVTCRGPRLRCLIYIVRRSSNPRDIIVKIIPEVVLCCKDVSKKCRQAAFALLYEMVMAMLRWHEENTDVGKDTVIEDFLSLVLPGTEGPPRIVSATLLALTDISHHFEVIIRGKLLERLLDKVCSLAVSPTREICGSALSYLKQFVYSFPPEVVGPFLPAIVNAVVKMTDDCKRAFRQPTRDMLSRMIRKFGSEAVESLVPKTDETLLKRLRNLRKLTARKKRVREEQLSRKAAAADEDSDPQEEFVVKARAKSIEEILADSDDDVPMDASEKTASGKSKRKAKDQACIQEQPGDIVDLADAFAISRISATKPGTSAQVELNPKTKDHGFKTSADGKLIIADNDSDSDETEKPRRRKMTSDSDDTNDGDDYETIDDDATGTPKSSGRKRKLTVATDGMSSVGPKSKYKAGGKGIHRPVDDTRSVHSLRARSSASTVAVGQQYSAKKAKGDVKKKGQPDPYAYVPLKRSALNKRKQHKWRGQFKNLVRGARKGAASGRVKKSRNIKK